MIGPGVGVQVYLAAGVTDMRRGISGLSGLAESVMRQNPSNGAVFAFRGRKETGSNYCIGMVTAFAFTTKFWSADTSPGPRRKKGLCT